MIRVKAGIWSFTPPGPVDDDGSYLRWHLLDHMPEQFQLPGVQHALRYLADDRCRAARIAGADHLADLGNAVSYLVGDPVEQTLEDFMALGPRLAEAGRFPHKRPSLQVAALALTRWYAAPAAQVTAEVVPWRPHRGVLLVVEERVERERTAWLQWLHAEHHQQVLDVPGVAGVWFFGSTHTWKLADTYWKTPQNVTAIYVDDDPVVVAKRLAPLVEQRWTAGVVRPLFAGPLRTMIQWEAWPAS
ncbi:MAG TPA: hypothetical protein VHE83_07220 [Mycobacteriales bacterium]|nr:hypothetical protein [Mycobacteriales bacterium]